MFGFFKKTIKAAGTLANVKDAEIARKIEDQNVIGFAEQDIEKMTNDLATVNDNIGRVKARIMTIDDEVKDLQEQVDDHTSKAEKLLEKTGNPEAEKLAQDHCRMAESLEKKIEIQKNAKTEQETLLAQQSDTKDKLEKALEECKTELDIMKTEKAVTDGNKTLATVKVGDASSALTKFQERRKKLHEELHYSQTKVEATKSGSQSLEEKTEKLLGKEPGSDMLAKLKAKAAAKTPAAA